MPGELCACRREGEAPEDRVHCGPALPALQRSVSQKITNKLK